VSRLLLIKPYRPERLFVTSPPLGLLAVAAYLREQAQRRGQPLTIRILDLNPGRRLPVDVLPEVREFQPDVIGISALSCEADAVHALTATLKREWPSLPLVLGGPFPSHDTEEALRDQNVDFLVLAEGELTFDELLTTLREGGDPATVAGIAYRREGRTFITPERPFIQDLDSLPMPAYDLIDFRKYFNVPRHTRIFAHQQYMTVVSTRGCPYKCVYCHVTMGKKTRFRSAEKVVEEVEYLVKHHGVREIQWSDDIWNLNRARSKKICDLLIERGIRVAMAFPNGVRGDLIDDELLDKLKAAGCYHITFAPETGSPRMQKFIEKNVKLDVLMDVIRRASERGIWCHGFFMVGFPTETLEEMRMTFDYALRSRLNTASFFIVNAHKGTKLYEMAGFLGLNVDYRPSAHNYMSPDFQLSRVPTDRVRRMIRNTYFRFFSSPRRLVRIMRTVPHKRQLLEFARELLYRIVEQIRQRRVDIYQAEGVPAFEAIPKLERVEHFNRL